MKHIKYNINFTENILLWNSPLLLLNVANTKTVPNFPGSTYTSLSQMKTLNKFYLVIRWTQVTQWLHFSM